MDAGTRAGHPRRRRSPKWPWLVGALAVFIAGSALGWALFLRDDAGAPSVGPTGQLSSESTASPSSDESGERSDDSAAIPREATEVEVSAEDVMADLVALNEAPEPGTSGGAGSPAASISPIGERIDASLTPMSLAGLTRVGPPSVTDDSVVADYRGPAGSALDILRLKVVRYADVREADAAVASGFEEFPTARITFEHGGRSIEQGATQEDAPERFPPALMLVWRQDSDVMTVLVAPAGPASASAARALALDAIRALPY